MSEDTAAGTSRRTILQAGLLATTGLAVAAAGAYQVFTGEDKAEAAVPAPGTFDETYRGRRITGQQAPAVHSLSGGHHGYGPVIHIDGHELHVMANGDGTFTTSVNHYESFRTPREAARRAVDTLGDLSPQQIGN
ncbi:tyrosinase family oxidase copper chaperone [Longispora albida]|uniref:tyrosinase family oxidase copper chaperone n=1 Tax=Longispora albida TaxID=203523 RepID=UPI0003628B16|nr:tyrosinase family oxidase copper chaperone [Longispora albida]